MNDDTLDYIAGNYALDKHISSGCHNYIPGYETLFDPIRYSVKHILEIGIGSVENGHMTHVRSNGYKTGNSLRCWAEYFSNATVYGLDIFPHPEIITDRIKTFTADQTDTSRLMQIAEEIGSDIDVIIDDGSHIGEHQAISFMTLYKYLSLNGVYVIEDVQPDYIPKFQDLSVFPETFQSILLDNFTIRYFDTRHCLGRGDDFMVAFHRKK